MEKIELVFIPSPGIGHLFSAVEFMNRLLDRHDGFFITVLLIQHPVGPTPPVEPLDRVRFVPLPRLASPEFAGSMESVYTAYIDSHKTLVKEAIAHHVLSKSPGVRLAGIVLDLFCSSMVDVAKQIGVPSYVYFTSGANFLAYMLYLPVRHELVGAEFVESDPESVIPGFVSPVPTAVLPLLSFNKMGYSAFLAHARRFGEARGIIVNTFAELESHVVGSFLFGDDHVPPVYTVGPILDLDGQKQHRERHRILMWLDDQPSSSVVFLCFGSLGSFGEAQLREIAKGLSWSGTRFVWAIRKPTEEGKIDMPSDYADEELREILPEDFMQKAEGEVGLVCGWAPQKEVLAHRAVGGFVCHCGWNSVLESLWCGVPMVTWPMYAEQQICAFEMARELGLAVEMRVDYRMDGGQVVGAREVEEAVRRVMEEESEVRTKVKEMSKKSREAVVEGGSSFTSIGRLIYDMLNQ